MNLTDQVKAHLNESDPDPDFHEADLAELISECLLDSEDMSIDVTSFADAGVMTRNVGLVVTVGGHQFQVTIVKSR